MGAREQEEGECGAFVKRRKGAATTDVSMEEGECGAFMKRRKGAAATDVSMELDFLDCPVCFHPLRPPIYHRITYYEKENHEKVCPHAPCFCPETGCNFTGSTMMLLNHFSAKHRWHSARVSYNKAFRIHIAQGSTALLGEDGQLFLVNMVLEPLGGLISVFCIQPHITGSYFKCKLSVSGPETSYYQVTQFQTKSTKLFDGLPNDCFLFFVPKVLLRDSGTNVTAMVSMTIIPP